jgi:catechol 2,3-dioxygenase-like lactoylglutathione lyase family enzyme
VGQSSRWHLTDIQRLLVAIMVAVSVFLATMAVGMGSGLLLVVALVLLTLIGLLVFLLGVRHSGQAPVQGEARVMSVPAPPIGSIVAPCVMRLSVDVPGTRAAQMRHRDPSVSVTKWPTVGTVLPVEYNPRNKSLRIRWDRVEPNSVEPVAPVTRTEPQTAPFYMDYADTAYLDEVSEPPRMIEAGDVGPLAITAAAVPLAKAASDAKSAGESAAGESATGESATGELKADPEVQARASDYELPMRASIPQPRPSEPASSGPAAPAGAGVGVEDESAAMGAMLVVSDLQRSVSFYRDLVGLRMVDRASNTAVLSYGGGRVLLRQLADMSHVDRRVSHLHIQVSDVDASYQEMVARGVTFVHSPRVISLGDRLNLWAATFRDPDGHDIAITQWRDRE